MNNSVDNHDTTDWNTAFIRAANKKDYRSMDEALTQGADINVRNVRGMTPLHAAVMSRSLDIVAWLSKRGASPEVKTLTGDTALHEAAKMSDQNYLRELLASKAQINVNVTNSMGSSPLIEAAGEGHLANMKQLIQAGANCNHKSSQGASAVLIAAAKQDSESVLFLLSVGADPNDTNSYGVSALISATEALIIPGDDSRQVASQKTVIALVNAGADVNWAAKSGNTAFAEAARRMNKRAMLSLIDAKANPNVHSSAGTEGEMSPLMAASYKHDTELIKKLINLQAGMNYTNSKGRSALTMAMMAPVKSNQQKLRAQETIELLVNAGAHLSQDNDAKIGLAHYGVFTENTVLLAIAKEKGGLEQRANNGATAVFYATVMRKIELLKELKLLGADFTAKNDDGQTIFHLLAADPYPAQILQAIELMRQNNDEKLMAEARQLSIEMKASALEFTQTLINFGVNINDRDTAGNTPLHLALDAMQNGRVDRAYVNFLVKNGADVSIRNELEDSPFIAAIKAGQVELSETWAEKLVAAGDDDTVKRAIYDVSWDAPELEHQVLGMKKVFIALKKYGVDASYQDDDGQFPLLIASSTNQEDLVHALIELGVDVNQRNKEGEVAAFHSIKENHPNITRILFDQGGDPDATRNDEESLISLAYRHQNSTAVEQIIQCRRSRLLPPSESKPRGKNLGEIDLKLGVTPAAKKMGI